MEIGRYRLLDPISAGRDGSSYRARDQEKEVDVELRVLGRARADAERWVALSARLRTARLIEHPSAVRVLDFSLDLPSPLLVVEDLHAPTLADYVAKESANSIDFWISLARKIAEAVDVGHRMGLPHGMLGPTTIWIHPERGPILDWTGTEVDSARLARREAANKSCRPVESTPDTPPSREADCYSLGALLAFVVTGRYPIQGRISPIKDFPGFAELIADLMAPAPLDRATARDALRKLSAWKGLEAVTQPFTSPGAPVSTPTQAITLPATSSDTADWSHSEPKTDLLEPPPLPISSMLGRFKILERIGQGGMGAVYRAEDLADGKIVAIKVLSPHWSRQPESLKRFMKEARLLSKIKSPYVTNFVEVNNDHGVFFLALEYVAGSDLTAWIKQRGPLKERVGLAIAAEVAKALGVAHERGIVHRDVKPENILVVREADPEGAPHVKLSDFGIAKVFEGPETTVLTKVGTILGTPLYMSPEQCVGGAVGPWSDVYSLGATLFHLLSGRPPFQADTIVGIIHGHQSESPPSLRSLNPALSEATDRLVAKCLAKRPRDRYANASELLADLERLLRGEPTAVTIHPILPAHQPRDVITYDWKWVLRSPPEALWPHVSNTDRVNRAVGIPPVRFTYDHDAEYNPVVHGAMNKAGFSLRWDEHPFEWIEGRRMGVLREYSSGPFRWFASVVELEPTADGGTILHHRVRLAPKSLLGRIAAAFEIGLKGKKVAEAVYRRIDAALAGRLGRGADADPFEPPTDLHGEPRRRIRAWMKSLGDLGLNPSLIESLADYVSRAPAQEVARIRPIALARRLDLDADEVVNACLYGAKEGVLTLFWDLICPICRVPSRMLNSLRELGDHSDCPACRADFPLDFAQSVELVFRIHPEIRRADVETYCLGGPSRSPHVVAQVRIAPHERLALDLGLGEGHYRLRGPQLPFHVDFRVEPNASAAQMDLDLSRGPESHLATRYRSQSVVFTLRNPTDRELVVRIERRAPREDVLTAARVASLPLFRSLFPGENLEPGRLISLATVTLLITDLQDAPELYDQLGDMAAFTRIHEQFLVLEELVRKHRGSLVKTIGEGIVAVFDAAANAFEAAIAIPDALHANPVTSALHPRVSIHRGPAMVATLNQQIDYFGASLRLALALARMSTPNGITMTSTLAADEDVAKLIDRSGRRVEVLHTAIPELKEGFVYRLELDHGESRVREEAVR